MTSSADAGPPAGRFLDTAHGRIFCMHWPAVGDGAVDSGAGSGAAGIGAALVVVPPFAEEMNRCRRMWSLLAAQLARDGIATLIPDLHGTGESEGDFADARWESWRDDVAAACSFARQQGARRIALLGVRLGALLALDWLRRAPGNERGDVTQLILWQPVLDGKQHLNQFLRLKLAAGLRQTAAAKETTGTLREKVARGERLEVAGYELTAELLAAVDALDARTLAPGAVLRVDWLEVSTSEAPALLPASERVLEAWRAGDARPEPGVVRGEPFWTLQEITIAPELNTRTRDVAAQALAA